MYICKYRIITYLENDVTLIKIISVSSRCHCSAYLGPIKQINNDIYCSPGCLLTGRTDNSYKCENNKGIQFLFADGLILLNLILKMGVHQFRWNLDILTLKMFYSSDFQCKVGVLEPTIILCSTMKISIETTCRHVFRMYFDACRRLAKYETLS